MKPRWLAVAGPRRCSAACDRPARRARRHDAARRAQALIAGLDYDEARARAGGGRRETIRAVAVERARLAIYELDCDGAAAILARPEVQKTESGEQLADIARGCQRVTAAPGVDRDEARGIEVRWQDEHDRALAPLIFDTVATARDALTRDLGVDWPLPTRIVVVRDLLSLSAMTGLPYKSAQTTGTVAVAKWGRVTLLSPRASHHGYAWRDTHRPRAHAPGRHARLARPGAPLAAGGRRQARGDPLARPGPVRRPALARGRRAARPGAEPRHAARQARARASRCCRAPTRRWWRSPRSRASCATTPQPEGDDALPKLLAELRAGKDPDAALHGASGADLKAWDGVARLHRLPPARAHPGLFGLGGEHADADKLRDLRDRSRLAELLMAREHAPEAVQELDRIELAGSPVAAEGWERAMGTPACAGSARGRSRRPAAGPRASRWSPIRSRSCSSYGPWWAIRGRWARLKGDEPTATASFIEAVAADPLEPGGGLREHRPRPHLRPILRAGTAPPCCDPQREVSRRAELGGRVTARNDPRLTRSE